MTKQHYSWVRRQWRHPGVISVAFIGLLLAACTSQTGTSSVTSATTDAPPTTAAPVETADTPNTTETTTPTTGEVAVPHPLDLIGPDFEGALLGVSTGLSKAERAPRFRQLEADAGRQYDIGHVFHAWDKAIPTEDDLMHLEDGRILMISWNGTDTKEIASGSHDDWIRQQAQSVKDLEQPLLLRWFWEMDGNRKRGLVHSGPDYVAAWIHVRSIFDDVGADNAQFVWCPNEFLFWNNGDPEPWYPGDEHVDWLCADGYNWADTTASDEWVHFDHMFEDFIAWAGPRNKPIVIGETGSNEAEEGEKGDWLRSLPQIIQNELPEVDAVVYFDKDFRSAGHADWRVDTSESTYQGWIDMSNDPYFNQLDNPAQQ